MFGVRALAIFALAALAAVQVSAFTGVCTCSGVPTNCDAGRLVCATAGATGGVCVNGQAGANCVGSGSGNCADYQSAGDIYCTGACGAAGAGSGTFTCTDDSSSKCFPANATVQLENGSTKRMDALTVGDKVLASGPSHFSDVYMFSHKLSAVRAEFVRISTAGGRTVMLTGNHYLYVNGKLAVAGVVKTGDEVMTAAGEADKVVSVSNVWADGLYNPHTMHGDLVVDGIQTSTYTADIDPTLAHAALWPVRMLHSMGRNVVGSAFDEGSDLIASLMPNGKQKY